MWGLFRRIGNYGKSLTPLGIGRGVAIGVNLICLGHLFTDNVARLSLMYGPSMLPTFEVKSDLILEYRLPFTLGSGAASLRRGDLIVYDSPHEPGHKVCKRVLGLPGDIICVDPTGARAPSTEHVLVPQGHVWTSGDNADNSRDSRYYGPVPIALISGFVWARVWPAHRFTYFGRRSAITYLG